MKATDKAKESSEIKDLLSRRMVADPHVGGYRIANSAGYTQVSFTTKPNWFHRKMMKLCLGWEWVDNK